MNSKMKLLIGVAAFIVLIGGASIAFNFLSEKIEVPEIFIPPATVNTPDAQTTPADPDGIEDTRVPAPDFITVDETGTQISLSHFIGKPVVLNFWASWCPPCKAEMPDFNKVYQELGDDVAFMMINLTDGGRETKEKAMAYVAEEGFTFPIFYDTSGEAANAYGISSIPTTFFIDEDGYIVTGAQGAIDESLLRKGIDMIRTTEAQDAEYRKISASEAKELLESRNAILLDVRTSDEFAEGRIPGAILLPDYELSARASDILPDKDALILVYCRSGRRSALAANELISMGYTNVYDFGGILDWPFETEKD